MASPEIWPRPPIVDLCQPWYNDEIPELWVTAPEFCALLGYGNHHCRHPKKLLELAEKFGVRIWHNTALPMYGRERYFFRLQLSDLDAIRKLRERRREVLGDGRGMNPVELFLERNKERLSPLKLR